MGQGKKYEKVIWYLVCVAIIGLTLLGYIKGIFISSDIDESYALAQSYRLAVGDKLFVDMWESHQLSAFLGAIFIKIYLAVFGTTEYLVIYLRMIGILMHTGIGIWLYNAIKKDFSQRISFLVLFLHFNFLPKWVQMPEFELMHYWFVLMIFLLLYGYFGKEKRGFLRPALAGVCVVGSMMSYPTMILLYPFLVIGLCVLEKQRFGLKGIKRLKSSLYLTLGALISGGSFLVYLLSYQSISEFMENVSYIFLDESHSMEETAFKWQYYKIEIGEHFASYFGHMGVALIIVAVALIIRAIILWIKEKSLKNFFTKKGVEFVVISLMVLTAVFMEINQVFGSVLQDENQFYLLLRFVAVLIPAVYLGIRYHKKFAAIFWLCIIPGIVSYVAALLITNMTLNVCYAKMFLGVFGSILLLSWYVKDMVPKNAVKTGYILIYALILGLLCGFFVCRVVLIRVTGCLPVTIKAPLCQIEEGPGKGIYVLNTDGVIWNENYEILKDRIKEDDRLLYIGPDNMIYPAMECDVASPSTQGTTVYNEMFIYYYEKHKDRIPNVIVIDKTFESNPIYHYSENNQILLDWIEETFEDVAIEETNYLKILRVQE